MSWPTVSVPNIKANDAEPRIQPYSNSVPANRGLAALTDNASAREVVGAREAAWITVMESSNAKECAHNNAAAEPAANAVQIARAKAQRTCSICKHPNHGSGEKTGQHRGSEHNADFLRAQGSCLEKSWPERRRYAESGVQGGIKKNVGGRCTNAHGLNVRQRNSPV
jgi:hypothetical protein